MTSEIALQEKSRIKEEIVHLISNNFSAINLIAEHLDTSEEIVTTIITELVESDTVNGGISPDGLRFYRSDVKMSAVSEEPVEEEQKDDTIKYLIPKAILGTGIALFIIGQILIRIMAEGAPLYNTAGGMVMVGLITIFAGLFLFTKFE